MKGQIDGTRQMQAFLKNFPVRLQRDVINSVAGRGATVVKNYAKKNLKKNASVDSGTLLKSLRTKKKRGRHGMYRIFSDRTAPHAHLVEFGTRERFLKKESLVALKPGKWITIKRSGKMPAKPFFRPAFDENKEEILKQMAIRMIKRMSKEAEKMSAKYRTLSKTYRKKLAK